jgi:DNA polymerase-1
LPKADALLFAYLLDPSNPVVALGTVCRTYMDYALRGSDDVTGKGRERKPLHEVEVAQVTGWGAERAEATLAAGRYLHGRLEKAGLLGVANDVELPLAALLGRIEGNGIRLDGDVMRELGVKVGEDVRELERKIQEAAGFPINPGSPKQLGEYLFETLGLRSEHMRKTKSGVYSTDADVLEELVDAHPVVPLVLEHRELAKLKGGHLDALLTHVSRQTGRLHTSFAQTIASTGRLASQNPNLQNVPIRTALGREIRRAFVAEPGHVLLSADYSQIELRIVAHFSADPVLVDAFARDLDVHQQTAAEVFGVPAAEVTAEQRRVAKAVNYGLGYGQSDFGLARAVGIEREEARRYIETYFARFAGVKSFMEGTIADAKKDKLVRTLLGRKIPVVGIHSTRYGERAAAERFARNAPIQGSAADVMKLAMLAVDQALAEERTGKMLLTIHDELVIEVPEADAERVAARVKAKMEGAYALRVPLRVDVGTAKTWAGAH